MEKRWDVDVRMFRVTEVWDCVLEFGGGVCWGDDDWRTEVVSLDRGSVVEPIKPFVLLLFSLLLLLLLLSSLSSPATGGAEAKSSAEVLPALVAVTAV